ncbi:MAG: FAD-dependent oxidoreductase, partial [Pseudomonadota bacterium]
ALLCGPFGWYFRACAPHDEAVGYARFDTLFWTANVNPSDRYVLSLPGSLKHRVSPLDRHFDNLTVAGDWTRCGHQAGCVEAAVMSGRLAAHALSRAPRLEEIVGYDHP